MSRCFSDVGSQQTFMPTDLIGTCRCRASSSQLRGNYSLSKTITWITNVFDRDDGMELVTSCYIKRGEEKPHATHPGELGAVDWLVLQEVFI